MARALTLFLALAAGCYNPTVANPGFFCHPGDQPACPEGQECIDERCRTPGQAPADLATLPSTDMASGPSVTGCSGHVTCILNCGSADRSCTAACDAKVTMDGRARYDAAVGCGQVHCIDLGECRTSGAILIDGLGRPAGSCDGCLDHALADLAGQTCPNPASPSCNPAACTALVSDCKASTP